MADDNVFHEISKRGLRIQQLEDINAELVAALESAHTLVSCIVEAKLLPMGYNKEWTDAQGNRHTAGCMSHGAAIEIKNEARAVLRKAREGE